ncbi:MAG: adenosine deaminase [Alphaproteobacteria bacterium]|jgi:adenosine deaminase
MAISKLSSQCECAPSVTFDLHCHLRGTLQPAHAISLARRNGVPPPVSSDTSQYGFSTFEEFLAVYDRVGHVIRSPSDLRDVTLSYLKSVSGTGTVYVEFMISPGHSITNGIDFSSQISAIADAIEEAEAETGIQSSIIITCVRHRGPEEALEIAELAAASGCKHIRGFGLTGNERLFDAAQFRAAFLVAQSAGFGLTAHAGEWLPAETVLHTIKSLNLSRVGHGISVAHNMSVLAEIVSLNTGFEICLSSNFALKAARECDQHPARLLINAGCRVAFATDDPAYFQTIPSREIDLAISRLNLTIEEQWRVVNDSIDMAFCDESVKRKLRLAAQVSDTNIALQPMIRG